MRNLFIFILTVILMTACKKENQQDTSNNPQNQAIQIDSFPVAIGHVWKYHTESHITDTLGTILSSVFYENIWNIVSDTIINGELCTKILQLDSNYDGTTHLAYSYYANRGDGFYGVANENNGSLFQLKSTTPLLGIETYSFGLFVNPEVSIDTVFVPTTSLRLMKFPSSINDSWLSYEYNLPIPNIIKRKWIGYETITTEAGIFNCIKLQMFRDADNDNLPDSGNAITFQYFSNKGLIQEEFHNTVLFAGSNEISSIHRISKLTQINF